jgi:hypothetical protein
VVRIHYGDNVNLVDAREVQSTRRPYKRERVCTGSSPVLTSMRSIKKVTELFYLVNEKNDYSGEYDIEILSEITGEDFDDESIGIFTIDSNNTIDDDFISIRRKTISSEPFFSEEKTIFYEEIHRISMNEYKTYLRDKKISELLKK